MYEQLHTQCFLSVSGGIATGKSHSSLTRVFIFVDTLVHTYVGLGQTPCIISRLSTIFLPDIHV